MGVLNATPDSFSGDGLDRDVEGLVARGLRLAADGAAILDVGGESTRPGATPVGADEELRRVIPVVRELARRCARAISVDTGKAAVAEAALGAGATIVNDVWGLGDPGLASVAARHGAWLVVTHNGWTRGDKDAPGEVVVRVALALAELVERARYAGVRRERIVVDPGLGFGKGPEHSLELLRRLGELRARFPEQLLLIGPSRKGFTGHALGGAPAGERLEGTLACVALAVAAGADMVRVHDVAPAVWTCLAFVDT